MQQQFELDPFTNTLFLFCGRRRDRIKGLYWEKDGFILLYKRLEQGAYQWPRSESKENFSTYFILLLTVTTHLHTKVKRRSMRAAACCVNIYLP